MTVTVLCRLRIMGSRSEQRLHSSPHAPREVSGSGVIVAPLTSRGEAVNFCQKGSGVFFWPRQIDRTLDSIIRGQKKTPDPVTLTSRGACLLFWMPLILGLLLDDADAT